MAKRRSVLDGLLSEYPDQKGVLEQVERMERICNRLGISGERHPLTSDPFDAKYRARMLRNSRGDWGRE